MFARLNSIFPFACTEWSACDMAEPTRILHDNLHEKHSNCNPVRV